MSTILVVDDDPNNQRVLNYTLRKAGYTLLQAPNGQIGLDILRQARVDLIILDMSMPVMDGLSMLRAIRSSTHLVNQPVIILTASSDDHEMAVAEKIGFQACLTKPTSSRVLLQTVADILNPDQP
jgi:two-component system chemotaxis response regulator CheY